MRKLIRTIGTVAATAALVLAAGCSGDDDKDAAAGGSGNGQVEKVKYITGAGVQGRESYIYVAQEKGFFKEAGFDVEVVPGAGTQKNLQLLQSGAADFAVIDITAGLIEYGKGTYKDFTIVSAIQQRNLACFMALSGTGITTPKDLAGKRIAYIPGGVVKTLFDTYAKLAGIDGSKIQWKPMQAQDMGKAMVSGQIDAATQFVVGKPAIEKAAEVKKQTATVLPFSDQLVDLYGNGLGVSKKTLQENPDRVKRFNNAMLKGLQYALDHPDEAGQIYAKYQKIQPAQLAAAEVKLMAPYSKSTGTTVGQLDEQRVTRNIAVLQGAGTIPGTINPKDVISFDYVNNS